MSCSALRWRLLRLSIFFVFFFIAQLIELANSRAPETLPADNRACGLRPAEHAFIFYGLRPSNDVLNFAVELSLNSPYDVYVVPDDLTYVWADAANYPLVHWAVIPNSTVLAANFSHASRHFLFDKPRNESIQAMDRALTLAASDEFTMKYCRMWLIEDDVFIPSVAAAIHVDKLASGDYDFISTSDVFPYQIEKGWLHWPAFKAALHQVSIPTELWSHCMVNSIALSPRYLKMLQAFAALNGQLIYAEPMFATFVAVWKLRHLKLTELYMVWRNQGDVNYSWKEVAMHKLWWYHPMKNDTLRQQYRAQLYPQQTTLQPPGGSTGEDKAAFDWHARVGDLNRREPATTGNRPPLPKNQPKRNVQVQHRKK